jgi:hypothetical protein
MPTQLGSRVKIFDPGPLVLCGSNAVKSEPLAAFRHILTDTFWRRRALRWCLLALIQLAEEVNPSPVSSPATFEGGPSIVLLDTYPLLPPAGWHLPEAKAGVQQAPGCWLAPCSCPALGSSM